MFLIDFYFCANLMVSCGYTKFAFLNENTIFSAQNIIQLTQMVPMDLIIF